MKNNSYTWKKGRGKLGAMDPLIGSWEAKFESPMGKGRCIRSFIPILRGAYIQLTARWEFKDSFYEEQALYGVDENRKLAFWSFTSDGKHSQGVIADASDIHPQALGFEAQMPTGLARMVYWPNEMGDVSWVVESKTKKGWNRFTEHNYTPV